MLSLILHRFIFVNVAQMLHFHGFVWNSVSLIYRKPKSMRLGNIFLVILEVIRASESNFVDPNCPWVPLVLLWDSYSMRSVIRLFYDRTAPGRKSIKSWTNSDWAVFWSYVSWILGSGKVAKSTFKRKYSVILTWVWYVLQNAMINICNAFQAVVVMPIVLWNATVPPSIALDVSDSSFNVLDKIYSFNVSSIFSLSMSHRLRWRLFWL